MANKRNARLQIQFLGAIGTVTGSKTLVRYGRSSFLVDCGLFQGLKSFRLRNRDPFPIDARKLDSVVLSHAHLDHCGHLPLLVKEGFRGRIFCTAPTKSLAKLVLEDAAAIQEEDADYANREGFSKHHPALPLFTRDDVRRTVRLFETVREGKGFRPIRDVEVFLQRNGHILGSCFVDIHSPNGKVVFSGDLGRKNSLLFPDPKSLVNTDALVLESTYGDRLHEKSNQEKALSDIISETYKRGGTLFIPSFAIGRTQEILLLISQLKEQKRIPEIPVYLDSPMAGKATEIFVSTPGWHKLTEAQSKKLCDVAKWTRTPTESIRMMRDASPKVVIAGSGMAAGGRILHHLAQGLPHPQNTVLFIGYQGLGTRGRQLLDGAAEIKMHGKFIPVRAQVKKISSFSAHADQGELLDWVRSAKSMPKTIYLQHGDPQAIDVLRCKMKTDLGETVTVVVPQEKNWYTV